jgi:hypothetical protein
VECGDSLAFLQYEIKKDLIKEIREDIENKVDLKNGDRIYIIYKKENKTTGTFLRGGRKMSPWSGYAPSTEKIFDE